MLATLYKRKVTNTEKYANITDEGERSRTTQQIYSKSSRERSAFRQHVTNYRSSIQISMIIWHHFLQKLEARRFTKMEYYDHGRTNQYTYVSKYEQWTDRVVWKQRVQLILISWNCIPCIRRNMAFPLPFDSIDFSKNGVFMFYMKSAAFF